MSLKISNLTPPPSGPITAPTDSLSTPAGSRFSEAMASARPSAIATSSVTDEEVSRYLQWQGQQRNPFTLQTHAEMWAQSGIDDPAQDVNLVQAARDTLAKEHLRQTLSGRTTTPWGLTEPNVNAPVLTALSVNTGTDPSLSIPAATALSRQSISTTTVQTVAGPSSAETTSGPLPTRPPVFSPTMAVISSGRMDTQAPRHFEQAEIDNYLSWQGAQVNPFTLKTHGQMWAESGINQPAENPALQQWAQEMLGLHARREAVFGERPANWEGDWRTAMAEQQQALQVRQTTLAALDALGGVVIGGNERQDFAA